MRVGEMDLLALVPYFMQEDKTVNGLCESANYILMALESNLHIVNFINDVGILEETDLDYIAKISGLTWYQDTFALEKKIATVERMLAMFYVLGTNKAVKNVLDDLFDGGEVFDWYDYGGEPNHFKMRAFNSENADTTVEVLIDTVNTVKRKSSFLDKVEITVPGTTIRYHAILAKEEERVLRPVNIPNYKVCVVSKEVEKPREEA